MKEWYKCKILELIENIEDELFFETDLYYYQESQGQGIISLECFTYVINKA